MVINGALWGSLLCGSPLFQVLTLGGQEEDPVPREASPPSDSTQAAVRTLQPNSDWQLNGNDTQE